MNIVSPCCLAPIGIGHKTEYPLGGFDFTMTFKIDICESCGKEVEDYIHVCETCGEQSCQGVTCQ